MFSWIPQRNLIEGSQMPPEYSCLMGKVETADEGFEGYKGKPTLRLSIR